MAGLVAHPWKRFGHDRVYFKTIEGNQVGWVDRVSQVAHLEDEACASEFSAAVSLLMAVPIAPDAESGPATPVPLSQPRLLAQGDLVLNRPGQRAAEVERAVRSASPIRSRLARLYGLDTEERHWRPGRKGEEAVAARLARLSSEWRVLHSIEVGVGGSDIDHLAIGPGGVYTINAKHHPDASVWVGGECFMVNGHRQPYVRNSRYEAGRAARILSQHTGFPVSVVGVIAVMGARGGFAVKAQPADGKVHVLTRNQIDTWLRRRRTALNGWEIGAIFDVARDPEIWTRSTPACPGREELGARGPQHAWPTSN